MCWMVDLRLMEISSESEVYMEALFLITEEGSKATNESSGEWGIEATCSSQRTPNTASTKQRPSSLSNFGDSSNRRMKSFNTASRGNKSKGCLTSLFKRACEAQRYHTVRQNESHAKNNVKADKVWRNRLSYQSMHAEMLERHYYKHRSGVMLPDRLLEE